MSRRDRWTRRLAAGALLAVPAVLGAQPRARDTAQVFVTHDSTRAFAYTRPRRLEPVRGIPGTLAGAAHDTFRREKLLKAAGLAALTGALVAADQRIYEETRALGRRIDLPPTHPAIDFRVGDVKLFYVPTTISSALYYLGDGWTTMAAAGTFYALGTIRHDHRALRTASEITESLLSLGVVTQTVKRIAGRQTPSEATAPGGRWRPFPSWKAYSANVPAYDAFPSGHVATAMSTVTVIAMNYPDNRWVRPLGYGVIGALGFAMINNGVHWASDYPLAVAIGATVGKVAARRGRTERRPPPRSEDGAASALDPDDAASLSSERLRDRVEPILAPSRLGLRLRF